jgi:Family of unknown function (DUF6325)
MPVEDVQVEIGPVDYVLIEWPDRQPNGEIAPIVVDLVERGVIRVLDIALITKNEDGTVGGLEISEIGSEGEQLKAFEGASSDLLSDDDLAEAAGALEPGASAALLVYENRWAAPFVSAVRRTGGELVASGRIPAPVLIEALEAAEETRAAAQD